MNNVSPHVIEQNLLAIRTIADCIREFGKIPSGHLYAQLMSKMDLNSYNRIIGILKNAKLISETNFELKWEGPKNEQLDKQV